MIVDTTVLNDGKVSMDLTCSFPIQNKLITADKRQYDPIGDLDKIQGNPECNDGLQPGVDRHMVYVYEILTAAVPVEFGFGDTDLQQFDLDQRRERWLVAHMEIPMASLVLGQQREWTPI